MIRTEEGKRLRKQYENHEIHHGYNEHRKMDIRPDEVSNTITTVEKDGYIAIKQATKQGYIFMKDGGVADLSYPTSKLRRGRVIDDGEVSPTVMAGESGIHKIDSDMEHEYRIRKLTAKECFRLMGFDDEDYDNAAEENSQTQLYKQAGNSIVVNVLVAIFSQLGIGGTKWNDQTIESRETISQNIMEIYHG